MENVTFIKSTGSDGVEREHALIDHGNGEYTSMPKSVYDKQQAQAEESTPMVSDEASSK